MWKWVLASELKEILVELYNSRGWDFESTIKFNASTGEEYCEWFVCGVCGTVVRLAVASQFPLFSSRGQQAAVGSLLRMEVILPNTSLLLNTLRQKKDLTKKDLFDISVRESVKLLT